MKTIYLVMTLFGSLVMFKIRKNLIGLQKKIVKKTQALLVFKKILITTFDE